MTILMTLLGLALGLLWPDRYTATASVTVESITIGEQTQDVNMETQRLVARSTEVLSIAAENVDDVSVAQLRGALQVNVPRGSQVLEFIVTAPSAEAAAEQANAIAEAYLEQRTAAVEERITEASATLTSTADELAAQAAGLAPDDPRRISLESQVQALQDQRAVLIATSFDAGALIDPAVAPTDTDKPKLYVFVAAGFFLGLFLGAFVALIRDRLARRGERAAEDVGLERAEPRTADDAAAVDLGSPASAGVRDVAPAGPGSSS
ncbi:uncharacterized protein involved in exopolysaccharide biosynthesis [Agromyces sp. 3263]|nr:uncharacterized protein involved in exopolysaccharide biosynthesis [Agromyces sp. 3263]